MELEKLGKLIDQWKGLLAGIAALLVAIVGVHKALTDLDSRTWSWPELAVAGVSIALLAIITLRTRTARLSRLLDPDALKLDPQSPERHWLAVGKHLALADNALAWRIGDWWVYGEHRHGDRIAIVRTNTWSGPSFGACRNYATVARAFETSRRRDALSFGHHREVASLSPEDADRLLDWAEQPFCSGNKPRSTRELRDQVRRGHAGRRRPLSGSRTTLAEIADAIARGSEKARTLGVTRRLTVPLPAGARLDDSSNILPVPEAGQHPAGEIWAINIGDGDAEITELGVDIFWRRIDMAGTGMFRAPPRPNPFSPSIIAPGQQANIGIRGGQTLRQEIINGIRGSPNIEERPWLHLCVVGTIHYLDVNRTHRLTSFFQIYNPDRLRFMRAPDDDEYAEWEYEA